MKTKFRKRLGKALHGCSLFFLLLFAPATTVGWIYLVLGTGYHSDPGFWLAAITGTITAFSFYRDAVDWSEFKLNFSFVLLTSIVMSTGLPWLMPAFIGLWGQVFLSIFWIDFYDRLKHNGEVGIEKDSPSFSYISTLSARFVPFLLTGLTAILVWKTEFYNQIAFWASVLVATFLAWTYLNILNNYWLKFLFTFVMAFGPIFLYAPRIGAAQYFGITGIVWVVAMSWMEYRRLSSPQKKAFEEVLPDYLPEGFKETSRDRNKVKDYEVFEIVYSQRDSDNLIWLIEANGIIPGIEPRKNAQLSNKNTNGINIVFAAIIDEKSRKTINKMECDFIEANWSIGKFHFNLRTSGISMVEHEGIIESIIAQRQIH